MRIRLLFAVVLFAVCIAGPAAAEKGPPKLRVLTPMLAELGEAPSDDALKALKVADRCANQDKTWEQAMRPEQQTGIDAIFELLAAPVTCWQGADKKSAKAGDGFQPVARYVAAQRGYVQAMRAYIFALQARFLGDQLNGCKRFKIAIAESATASTASEGLVEAFSSVEAKTIAATTAQNAMGIAQMITDEYEKMSCN